MLSLDAIHFPVDPRTDSPVEEAVLDPGVPELSTLVSRGHADLLTGTNGRLSISLPYREFVAYLQDGTLLVSRDDMLHPYVESLWRQIYAKGYKCSRILYVPPDTLGHIYEASDQRLAQSGGIRTQSSEAERKLSDCLRAASEARASDIHIVLTRYTTKVAFRIDGFLEHYENLPRTLGQFLVRVAYLVSDDSEGGALQYGTYQSARISGGKIVLPPDVQSLRLQFNPTSNRGYYLVIRLLYADAHVAGRDVDRLGYASFHLDIIRTLRARPSGLNLISGVTGSGKSTTLQRLLRSLLEEHANSVNLITIEDPPEYEIVGARQFPVLAQSTERSEGFVNAISAAMRSDPDVLMIGEVRDYDTAHLSVKAANTGHQVWTTVHATDALRSASRLVEEGIPRHRLMDVGVLASMVAQRLVRVLCPTCSLDWTSAVERGIYDSRPGFVERLTAFFEPLGANFLRDRIRVCASGDLDPCPDAGTSCRAGYAGRTLVAEVVQADQGLIDAFCSLSEGLAVTEAERYWVKEQRGIRMREHAFMKLIGGSLDPRDVDDIVGLLSFPSEERFDDLQVLAAREGLYSDASPSAVDIAELDLSTADLADADDF